MSNQKQMVKIAINKSILKEYKNGSYDERIVYLNNGSEFQIQIFNPHDFVVGAKIYINGSAMRHTLVLRPGERIWLERYLDKSVKFRFETYEVDADEETKKAIQNNGEVKVVFYKEEKQPDIVWNPLIYCDYDYSYSEPQPLRYSNPISTGGNAELNSVYTNDLQPRSFSASAKLDCIADFGEVSATNALNTFKGFELSTSACDTSFTTDVTTKPLKNIRKSMKSTFSADKIETGRIEEGGYSGQQFENVYRNFSSWSFATETIKLLPTSQKQYNAHDLKKQYCTQCGRKVSAKHKYCPYCGNKIE